MRDLGFIASGATFSPDRRYRYKLWRTWGLSQSRLVVIGLNPSTADESTDDPTIRRCIGFAKREGLDGLIMLNLFAFRSRDSKALLTVEGPIGPENDATIRRHVFGDYSRVLAAWGAQRIAEKRGAAVVALCKSTKFYCLGETKNGQPKHPLFVAATTSFRRYQ